MLEHEHAQDGAKHRQRNKLAHGVEECCNTFRIHDERRDYNRDAARNGTIDFADLYTFDIGSRRIDC